MQTLLRQCSGRSLWPCGRARFGRGQGGGVHNTPGHTGISVSLHLPVCSLWSWSLGHLVCLVQKSASEIGRRGCHPPIYEFYLESALTWERGALGHFTSPGKSVQVCRSGFGMLLPLGQIQPFAAYFVHSELSMVFIVTCKVSMFIL